MCKERRSSLRDRAAPSSSPDVGRVTQKAFDEFVGENARRPTGLTDEGGGLYVVVYDECEAEHLIPACPIYLGASNGFVAKCSRPCSQQSAAL